MKILTLAILVLSVSLAAGCGVTTAGLSNDAGYAPLAYPARWEADTAVSVSLGPWVMRTALNFTEDDPETAALLAQIRGLRVRVYNVNNDAPLFARYLENSTQRLLDEGWQRAVSVNELGKRAAVFVKMHEDSIAGLSVISIDETEAVFLNIIGNISLEALPGMMHKIDDLGADPTISI